LNAGRALGPAYSTLNQIWIDTLKAPNAAPAYDLASMWKKWDYS